MEEEAAGLVRCWPGMDCGYACWGSDWVECGFPQYCDGVALRRQAWLLHTTAFYLNKDFCCWGEDNCEDWHRWTSLWPINYILYFVFSIIFALTSASLVKAYAPYAAGSGISEIKCIIAGFVMKGFLGFWTLLIKSISLPLAIASGLSVGKEGPSVHYAVCTGNVISRFFDKYKRNAAKTREILSACAAAGVAVAFGSPIGGVLFLAGGAFYFRMKL